MSSFFSFIRKKYQRSGIIEKLYAALLLGAFLPFVIVFILLWRYCIGVFSDSINQSARESFWSRQNRLDVFAEEYTGLGHLLGQDELMDKLLHSRGNPSFLSYRINQRVRTLMPLRGTVVRGVYFLTQDREQFLVLMDRDNTHLFIRGSGSEKYDALRQTAQICAEEMTLQTGFFDLRGTDCVAVSFPSIPGTDEMVSETVPVTMLLLEKEAIAQIAQLSTSGELPWAFRIHSDAGLISEDPSFETLLPGGEMLEDQVKGLGWNLNCVINMSSIRADAMRRFGTLFLAALAAYILLVVLITILVNRQLHTLTILRERMASADADGIYREIELPNGRDMAYLFSGYNEMVHKVKKQEDIILDQNRRNMEIAEKQRVAELKALELEINPHYLYNTLNTINSVAIEHGDYQVSRLLKGYSSTLVYMLRDRFRPVAISQEVAWLREYLLLQQERFPGLFTYEIDAEPELMDTRIYKMLLQPFVENSILHGFEEMDGEGFLSILFYGDGGKIVISIWDNGKGIAPDELERLRAMARRPMETESERIGILNSCRRLYGYYGDDYTLTIEAAVGKGTRVELHLPYLKDEQVMEEQQI